MKRTICGGLLLGASFLALQSPVAAQDAAPQDEEYGSASSAVGGNVIIVQARRRDEGVQDVPAVVQAVSNEQLEKLELRDFEQITALVPGLSLEAELGGGSGSASLRGIDFDARAAGSNTAVEFYRNDAVIPSTGVFGALFDIDQIEVLRGPQGTLKGRASPSGSITVYTRKPDMFEYGGYASATYAEGDDYNLNGAINLPFVQDVFGVRFAALMRENDGTGIRGLNAITGEIDDDIYSRTQAIRASARATPFDDVLILDFNYERQWREGRSYDQIESLSEAVPGAGASPIFVSADDRLGVGLLADTFDQDMETYNWQAQLNLFGQSLIYLGQDFDSFYDRRGTQDSAGVVTNPLFNNVPFAMLTGSGSTVNVHEIRLQNEDRVFGMFDYVVGYLNLEQTSPTLTTSQIARAVPSVAEGAPFVDLALNLQIPVVRFREGTEESFFGNITAHIGDRLELSGGIRFIEVAELSGVIANGNRIPAGDACRGFDDPNAAFCEPAKTATIYSASAKYDVTDDIIAYASYGTSFRVGNVVVATDFVDLGDFVSQFIRPGDETSQSYEVGIKTNLLNDTLRFNVSGFYQTFENFAFRPGSPVLFLPDVYEPGDTIALEDFDGFVVPSDAEIKGVEAEIAWVPSDNFSINSVVSYTDGKISDALFPCVDLNDDNVPDATPPTAEELFAEVGANQVDTCLGDTNPGSSPKWAASVVAEYNRELSYGVEGFVRGLVDFQGNNEGVGINPLDQVDAYALFDLFLGVRDAGGAWTVSLYGKNLFDTSRVIDRDPSVATTSFRFSAPQSGTNYIGITTLEPQEFGISARFAVGSR